MKLTAIALLKWNGDKEPVLFGVGTDLSSFGFFQRGSVKEMLTFVARTVAKRTLVGQRQTVQNEEYYCHAYNRDGVVGYSTYDSSFMTFNERTVGCFSGRAAKIVTHEQSTAAS